MYDSASQLVSVIMPAYNASPWIEQAIESVQVQTWIHWELIVMDDGSTDNTADLVGVIAAKDNRIRYFFQTNQGQGKARAAAIHNSKGHWIALLDADDYWLPERLQVGLKTLKASGAEVFFSAAAVVYENGNDPSGEIKVPPAEQSGVNGLKWLLTQNSIPALTTLFSREAYDRAGGFGNRRLSEDYALWLNMMFTGSKFVGSPEVLAVYRFHNESSSAFDRLLGRDCMEIFGELRNAYPQYKNLIRQYMVLWIEEKLCRGCKANSKFSWYKKHNLLNGFSILIFKLSSFLPGRYRSKLLPWLVLKKIDFHPL
jgi:glycosyltransferase involved in cell wall biosynthesis